MEVLYEDNHLIVVYKDRGILAQADGSGKKDILNMVKAYLKEKYHKPGNVYCGLVHRLDMNTEGLMVFAKTSKAANRLSKNIKEHNFNKSYLAIVEGTLKDGTLIDYLVKDEINKKAYVAKEGKEARLHFKVLMSFIYQDITLSIIQIELETGRFHQIRCQFANIGHPLFGDNKYGSKYKTNFAVLQAYQLSFKHVISQELLIFKKVDYTDLFKQIEGII